MQVPQYLHTRAVSLAAMAVYVRIGIKERKKETPSIPFAFSLGNEQPLVGDRDRPDHRDASHRVSDIASEVETLTTWRRPVIAGHMCIRMSGTRHY